MPLMSEDIWDYQDNFRYDEPPIDPDDPRWVELGGARGDYDRNELWNQLRYDAKARRLRGDPRGQCTLIGGHRGCGKSTELRVLARGLERPQAYVVVQVDALRDLDIFHLTYGDLLLAMVAALAERLSRLSLSLDQVYVQPVQDWFLVRTEAIEQTRSLAAEASAGVDASAGLPLIAKLFARLTAAIKTNTSYRETLQRQVRDGFGDLAKTFDDLIGHALDRVRQANHGRAILFVVDGLDRLLPEDADRFFVEGVDQLRLLRVPNLLICAPIRTLIEKSQVSQTYEGYFKVPMVKLDSKDGRERFEEARAALREFLTHRLPERFFDDSDLLNVYIDHCGGHPRDLLRLINLSFTLLHDESTLTHQIAERAFRKMVDEYQNLVQPDDYAELRRIDAAPPSYRPMTDRNRRLLYDLVLLEYNATWWRSHPAVRASDAYQAGGSVTAADDEGR